METSIDVGFDFRTDTPPGKDADLLSPTLREYHRRLWSKQLPTGHTFTLTQGENAYLLHESSLGRFALSSDAITTRLKGRAAKVLKEIPSESLPPDLGYTIGSAIIFPGNRIDGASTINGARGFHPRIADRFDLTLECIRRHYLGESSPLAAALQRYAASSHCSRASRSTSSSSSSMTSGTARLLRSGFYIDLMISPPRLCRRLRAISSTICRRTMSLLKPATVGSPRVWSNTYSSTRSTFPTRNT